MKLYPVFILTISLLSGICLRPVQAQNISGVVNTYHKVTAINTGTNTLTLSSVAGLSPGVKILIIQMKGATIDNTNSAAFGNITSIDNAGNYEFNYVCGVNGNDVLLVYNMIKSYSVSGLVQVVTVPRYTAAIVTDTLKAAPWDAVAGTGGVIAIEARNSITLTRPIDATGKGFKGGIYIDHPQPPYNCDFATNITAYGFANPASGYQTGGPKGEGITHATGIECGRGKLANGGGGSNNHNAGGAGGANYGVGGAGGQRSNEGGFNCHGTNPGIGGLALSSNGYSLANNRVFLGGGGGAGHGNNNVGMNGGYGGGIVFIKTDTLYGNNELILANGAAPYRAELIPLLGVSDTAGGDGGGGGGGGGVVIADVNTYTGNVTMQANGSNGSYSSFAPSPGCFGPGGGGGGGVIWVKTASLAPGVTTTYAGGTNGLVHVSASIAACRGLANGATPGGNGNLLFNYVPPLANPLVCAPLPLNDLQNFTAKENNDGVELNWKMRSIANIRRYEVERSIDKLNFVAVASVQDGHRYNFFITDKDVGEEFVYYRLKVLYNDGRVLYSQPVFVHVKNNSGFQLLHISPNPAKNYTMLRIRSEKTVSGVIEIYNGTGQKLLKPGYTLRRGVNEIHLDLHELPAGLYVIVIKLEGKRISQSFLKASH